MKSSCCGCQVGLSREVKIQPRSPNIAALTTSEHMLCEVHALCYLQANVGSIFVSVYYTHE